MQPNWLTVMAFTAILSGSAAPACAQQQIGAIDGWIAPADYPSDAVIVAGHGVVDIELAIRPDGTIGGCKIIRKTASQALADIACKAVSGHARYQPAGDHDGHPIAGRDILSVNWTKSPPAAQVTGNYGGSIPIGSQGAWVTDLDYNRIVAAVGTTNVGIQFIIGPAGRITSCGAFPASTKKELEAYTCALVANRARFIQPVGAMGQPLTTQGHTFVHWQKPQ